MPRQIDFRAPWRAIAVLRACVAAILTLAFLSPALAHSWYPYECCSEKDCFPVEARDVREVRGGWELSDSTFIPYHEARPSPDGKFHVCRHSNGQGALIRLPEKPACFWAPVNGS